MPRIRRWHPVAHHLNHDPEFIQLRREFGDWTGYMWLEILSWGDQNEGQLKGKPEAIALALSSVSLSKRPTSAAKTASLVLKYMEQCGWIRVESDRILIAKYADFHVSREAKQTPQGNPIASLPSEPSEPSEPNKHKEEYLVRNSESFAPTEQSQNGQQVKTRKEAGELPEQAFTLATKLYDSILANYPTARPATNAQLRASAIEIDKLHRLDGKTWEQIEWLLAWSQKDSFWSGNIQSGVKFRKQWNQLLAKASREQPQYSDPLPDEPQEDKFMRRAREAKEVAEQKAKAEKEKREEARQRQREYEEQQADAEAKAYGQRKL